MIVQIPYCLCIHTSTPRGVGGCGECTETTTPHPTLWGVVVWVAWCGFGAAENPAVQFSTFNFWKQSTVARRLFKFGRTFALHALRRFHCRF